ncbi:MAG: hypothetical protein WBM65_22770, partial [Sedimenticolaceae bacterium]
PLESTSAPEPEPVAEETPVEAPVEAPAPETAGDEERLDRDGGSGTGGVVAPLVPNIDSSAPQTFKPAQGLLQSLVVKPAALAGLAVSQGVPQAFELDSLSAEIRAVLTSSGFNDSLDRMRDEVSQDSFIKQSVVGSSVAVTTGLSVGYVAWLVRGGVLLSTALSSLPAWQFVDPLPVLARTRDDEDADGQDDSLQAIIEEQSARAAKQHDDGVDPQDAQDTPTRPD